MSSIVSEDTDVPNAKPRTSGSALSVVSNLLRQCDDLLPRAEERAEDSHLINRLDDEDREFDRTIREELQKGRPVDTKMQTQESRRKQRDEIATPYLETRKEVVAFINCVAESLRIPLSAHTQR